VSGGEDVEFQDVVINGIRYIPESSFSAPWFSKPSEIPRIGIAITTFNRPEMLQRTIQEMEGKLPEGSVLVVVDDGSPKPVTVPEGWVLHRFGVNRGTPAAKNKCIELLYEAGVEHFFLFDDDCYPTSGDWWVPYVVSPAKHLQFQFETAPDHWPIREIRRDNQHRVFDLSRGPMLYFTREVVDEIGGFHNAWGKRGGFHECFSRRANRAGLTEHPFMDVINPQLRCRDQDESGITSADHRKHLLWRQVDGDSLPLYAEFREQPIPVLVPRRDDNGHRDELWRYVKTRIWPDYKDFRVVEGYHVVGPFNRSEAINTAAHIAGNWDVAVVADGDAWVPEEQLKAAVKKSRETGCVVSAFTELWCLNEATTKQLLKNPKRPAKVPRPTQVKRDHRSICIVVPRVVFEAVGGFDEGYRSWGGEDDAFWHAATLASGEPLRVSGAAYHLWHPPASTREERAEDPLYIRNWNRWLRFKKLKSIEDVKRFK